MPLVRANIIPPAAKMMCLPRGNSCNNNETVPPPVARNSIIRSLISSVLNLMRSLSSSVNLRESLFEAYVKLGHTRFIYNKFPATTLFRSLFVTLVHIDLPPVFTSAHKH